VALPDCNHDRTPSSYSPLSMLAFSSSSERDDEWYQHRGHHEIRRRGILWGYVWNQFYLPRDDKVMAGIPYAKPPVGDLRFRPPSPFDWSTRSNKTFSATNFGNRCLQGGSGPSAGTSTSEDCLTLNVYRPTGTSAGAKLPVLAWIHGGVSSTCLVVS
jgi:hypothetical protein